MALFKRPDGTLYYKYTLKDRLATYAGVLAPILITIVYIIMVFRLSDMTIKNKDLSKQLSICQGKINDHTQK